MATSLHARDIANYFLANVDEIAGDSISNLKLQKLVYFAQGFFLAMRNESLFPEPIEAREQGPVVPELYQEFKHRGHRPIEPPQEFVASQYSPEVREILDAILKVYGQFSAWKLRDIALEEPPWRSTPRDHWIPQESLTSYFSELVDAGREGRAILGEPIWPTNSFHYQRRTEIMERTPSRDRLRTALARAAARKTASLKPD